TPGGRSSVRLFRPITWPYHFDAERNSTTGSTFAVSLIGCSRSEATDSPDRALTSHPMVQRRRSSPRTRVVRISSETTASPASTPGEPARRPLPRIRGRRPGRARLRAGYRRGRRLRRRRAEPAAAAAAAERAAEAGDLARADLREAGPPVPRRARIEQGVADP